MGAAFRKEGHADNLPGYELDLALLVSLKNVQQETTDYIAKYSGKIHCIF